MWEVTFVGRYTERTWTRSFTSEHRAKQHVTICRSNMHTLTVSDPVYVSV